MTKVECGGEGAACPHPASQLIVRDETNPSHPQQRDIPMISRNPPLPLLNARAALAWEFRERGRRELFMAVVAALTIPVMLKLADFLWRLIMYRSTGSWGDPTEWSALVHLASLIVQLASAVPLAWQCIARMDRQYVLPVSSRDLFQTRFVHGAAFVALATVIDNGLARLILGTDWPIVAPTLYGAVGWTAALWIGARFRGQELRVALASALVSCLIFAALMWHLFKFDGRVFVEQPFTPMAIEEVGILLGIGWLLSGAALRAGELDRCGLTGAGAYVPIKSGETSAIPVERTRALLARKLSPYRTSWSALFSEEWRRNGVLYPVAAAITTVVFCVITLLAAISNIQAAHLSELSQILPGAITTGIGFVLIGPFLQVAASSHGRQTLRHGTQPFWKLTLPIPDRHLAMVAVGRQLLSNTAAMLACWMIGLSFWMLLCGLTLLYRLWLGLGPGGTFPMADLRGQLEQFFQGTSPVVPLLLLVNAWVATGVSEAALQTGRRWCVGIPHGLLIGYWLSLAALVITLSPRMGEWYLGLSAFVGMMVSIASVIAAVRASVIPLWWGVVAFFLWGVVWTGFAFLLSIQSGPAQPVSLMWTEFFALSSVMLPIALPPLAVAWNRRR
jgi:hypothetical protein